MPNKSFIRFLPHFIGNWLQPAHGVPSSLCLKLKGFSKTDDINCQNYAKILLFIKLWQVFLGLVNSACENGYLVCPIPSTKIHNLKRKSEPKELCWTMVSKAGQNRFGNEHNRLNLAWPLHGFVFSIQIKMHSRKKNSMNPIT